MFAELLLVPVHSDLVVSFLQLIIFLSINSLMTSRSMFHQELRPVLFEEYLGVRKVILNRPQKLNSLTYEMVSKFYTAIKKYESGSEVKLVIVKGNGKAFCGGGDVIKIVQAILSGHWSFGARFYRRQLSLDFLLGTLKKPLVFFINGFVMGGGAGLSMNGTFRVVTENTIFAMPEVSIGLFPDVGASYFLNRLPGCFGLYLGLTGARIDGAEMLECGLATHFVLSKDLQLLENALCELDSSDEAAIYEVINKFTHKRHSRLDGFKERLEIINKCFSRTTVEDILIALEKETQSGASKWIADAIAVLKTASPTSLKVALRSIREGRLQHLEQCLTREYTVTCNMIRRTVNSDFFEGSRAMLFEKDKKPKWEPSEICQVSEEMVDRFFQAPEDDEEWEPLELPPITRLSKAAANSKL